MTKITLSLEELLALNPCAKESRAKLFGRHKRMDVRQAFAAGASIRDILWVAQKLGRRDLCIRFALLVAQRAEQYDKTGAAKLCNDATAAYITTPSVANHAALKIRRKAAYAAYADADADAAYAAYADADATYAAYAAYAVAYAAYADADAAAYATYAAADYAAARTTEIAAHKELLIAIVEGTI